MTLAVYIGSAIYVPGMPDIMETVGTSKVVANLGLTLFIVGYAVGKGLLFIFSLFRVLFGLFLVQRRFEHNISCFAEPSELI